MTKARLLGSVAAAALAAAPAAAQVTTAITADTRAGFATGTVVTTAGPVTSIAGGVQAGGNLFHSFATFNLGPGGTARWTAANPASVTHVINRVTGGGFSTIAGTLDTTLLPNASFYFINPAGVLFTGGAVLNVPGAAYISTAEDGLTFADGLKFSAVTADGSRFSMSAPQSFGFLGNQQPIIVDGVGNLTPAVSQLSTVDLSLFASNVAVRNSLITPNTITISTTAQLIGPLSLADPFTTAPRAGQTILNNASIFATAIGKGQPSVRIATGSFTQLGGDLSSTTHFNGDAGDLLLAAQTATLDGGVLSSDTGERVAQGDAGMVRLDVGSLHVTDAEQVSSSTFGGGAAGNVIVNAGDVRIDTQGFIGSVSAGGATGRAGTVQINASTLSLASGAEVSSSTNGTGDAGAVQIVAGAVTVDDAGIDSSTLGGTGKGGLVSVQADRITLSNLGELGSSSSGSGAAGAIQVKGGTLTLNRGLIFSNSLGDGAAGDVTISATSLNATDSAIATDSAGLGRAGVVALSATNIALDNSTVTSETNGSGRGGDVTVNAGAVSVSNNSQIATDTFGSGAAGRVSLTADQLTVDFASILSGAVAGSSGAAGSIDLNVGQLQLLNQSVVDSDTFGAGAAGSVSVTAKGVSLTGGSAIESAAREGSSGPAGQVSVHATIVTLDDALISSSTFGLGDAGDVVISAGAIRLSHASSVESGAGPGSAGRGGQVQVVADSLLVQSASGILTTTVSSGDAGQLRIQATNIVVDEAQLASRAQNGATGAAGALAIQGTTLSVVNGGQVETASANPKPAGGIRIAMDGAVSVSGEGSVISSANTAAAPGAAGSIAISGAPITLSDGGAITTNSAAGAAGDITLILPRASYVRLEGRTAPGVITTSSGPGTGGRITIADPLAIISDGGQILALGQARGANVRLTSDFFIRSADRVNQLAVDGVLVLDSQVSDVSAGVTIPDIAFLDASSVLRGQCPAARQRGASSLLRMRPFGPYAAAHIGPPSLSEALQGQACAFAPEGAGRGRSALSRGVDAAVVGQPPLTAPTFAATVRLGDVQVIGPGARGAAAHPRPGWTPGLDVATGLILEAPGPEGFDAAWIRRQFVANKLVGQATPLDRLLALTQLINLTFLRNGYVNSGVLFAGPVPEDGGVLQIRLVSGRGAGTAGTGVRFGPHGARGLTAAYVRARMAAAAAAPFNALDVEQQFRRLAQDPAVRTVGADLVPGAAPGEANLEVVVDPAPRYDVYGAVANSRSPSIGGERYAVGGSVRNLLRAGDVATAEAGVTGGRADESLGYDAPLFGPETSVTLRGAHDDAAVVAAALRPLGIRSTDWLVEGGFGWRPLDRPLTPAAGGEGFDPARSFTLGLRVAHREQRTWLLGEPFSFSPGSENGRSQYTVLRLTADYVLRGVSQVLALSASAGQGLGGSRSEALGPLDPSGHFHEILLQASYARRLDDRGLELRLRAAGQWADGPLYTGERFSLGGEDTVRGYRENLLLSDAGAFASAELARAFSLDAGRRGWARMDFGAFTGSAFLDAGLARNRGGPDPAPRSLASVGASLAWTPSEALFARLTYAKALRSVSGVGARDLQDRGLEFRVTLHPLALFPRD